MEAQEKKSWKLKGIHFLLLAIIIGFLAGISGEFFTRYYLSNFSFFRDLYFNEQTGSGQQDIIIRDPRKVVVEQDLRLNQIKNDISPAVLAVFHLKKSSTANLLDKVYLPDEFLGQAVVLTSDGWLLSTDEVVNLTKENLLVSHDLINYPVEKIVTDPQTGIVFLKIKAQNLPVVKLADLQSAAIGQSVVVYNNYNNQLSISTLLDTNYRLINNKYDLVKSSQRLDKYLLLADKLPVSYKGAAVINLQGEIMAFLTNQDQGLTRAIPINYLNSIISQVLKDEKISRPYLGINYLEAGQAFGLTKEDVQGAENGAVLWPDKNGLVISKDSPLADSGLVKGDVILSLENQKIDRSRDLADILLEYKTGQKVTLRYLHEQKESELTITLK